MGSQLGHEFRHRRLGQNADFLRLRIEQNRPILDNHEIEQIETWEHQL